MASLASIIIVTYNHRRFLDSCINSILKQDYPNEIIIIDNCSTDGTPQHIEKQYQNVTLIKNSKNIGYGAGNNLGVKHAKGDYIVILNPDTIVGEGWLRELVKPLEKHAKLITTPKILLYDGSAINTCGIINHFTGLTFTRGLNENPKKFNQKETIGGFSGCNFAIKKSDFNNLTGFDENFFSYHDDAELSWRANLADFKIIFVPSSIIRHRYSLKVSAEKIYHLEKGRYMILRKYLTSRELLLISFSLLTAEFLTFGYALRNGWKGFKYKLRALIDGIRVKIYKNSGNRANLFKFLFDKIPIDQLTSNIFEKFTKIFSNFIFTLNYKALRQSREQCR